MTTAAFSTTFKRCAVVALVPAALLLGACSDAGMTTQSQNSTVDLPVTPGTPGTTTTTTTTVVTTRAADAPVANVTPVQAPVATSRPTPVQAPVQAPVQSAVAAPRERPVRVSDPAPERRAEVNQNFRGRVVSIEPIEERNDASGVGAVAGGVLGGVLGNQVGGGSGRTAATVLGAVGGAVAGNQIEKRRSSHVVGYRVSVETNAGNMREFQRTTVNDLTVGARVRIVDGEIRPV